MNIARCVESFCAKLCKRSEPRRLSFETWNLTMYECIQHNQKMSVQSMRQYEFINLNIGLPTPPHIEKKYFCYVERYRWGVKPTFCLYLMPRVGVCRRRWLPQVGTLHYWPKHTDDDPPQKKFEGGGSTPTLYLTT